MGAGTHTDQASGTGHFGGGSGAGPFKAHFNQVFFGVRKNVRKVYPGRAGRLTPFAIKAGKHFMGGGFRRFNLSRQEAEGCDDFGPWRIRFPSRVLEHGAMLKAVSAPDAVCQSFLPFFKMFEFFYFSFH
jgi:hypothetical protein